MPRNNLLDKNNTSFPTPFFLVPHVKPEVYLLEGAVKRKRKSQHFGVGKKETDEAYIV
jgi:hypothetical protein